MGINTHLAGANKELFGQAYLAEQKAHGISHRPIMNQNPKGLNSELSYEQLHTPTYGAREAARLKALGLDQPIMDDGNAHKTDTLINLGVTAGSVLLGPLLAPAAPLLGWAAVSLGRLGTTQAGGTVAASGGTRTAASVTQNTASMISNPLGLRIPSMRQTGSTSLNSILNPIIIGSVAGTGMRMGAVYGAMEGGAILPYAAGGLVWGGVAGSLLVSGFDDKNFERGITKMAVGGAMMGALKLGLGYSFYLILQT